LPHALALADRNLHVGKRERAVLLRHELLARHRVEQVEHVLVEDFPGADLLLDHICACLL
jgi:hypothetical protein